MERSEEHHKSKKRNLLFLLPIFIQVAASVLFVLYLVKLNILQTWQLLIVVALLLAFLALNACLFFSKKSGVIAKIIGVILSIVVVVACYFGFSTIRATTNFISEITGDHYEVQLYEVRVLKDSGITSLNQLSRQKIGFLSTNPNLEETRRVLRADLPDYEITKYSEIGNLLLGLYNKEVPAVLISLNYLGYLEEVESTFEEDTIAIHEIEVTSKGTADLRQPVDIIKEPFIVYISGSDSRGTINAVSDSDVNILAVVNPEKGKILLVNVPRDYEVQIYGTTGLTDKLKSAGIFGLETSKKTIEELLDIEINYTIKVGFQAIRQLVDAIDGVDIESDMEITLDAVGEYKVCYINKGLIHLDGSCALAYSRHRKTLENGDLDRGVHQQVVLTAIINKITDLHYVTRIPQILSAAKDTFRTSLTEKEITDFVRWQLTELKHWKIESIQIGTSDHILAPTYTFPSQNMWLYLRDEASETVAKQKIAEYLKN